MSSDEQLYAEVLALRKSMDVHYAVLCELRDKLDAIAHRVEHCPDRRVVEIFDRELGREHHE